MRRPLVRDLSLLTTVVMLLAMGVLAVFGWRCSLTTQQTRESTQRLVYSIDQLTAARQACTDTERAALAYLIGGDPGEHALYRDSARQTMLAADRLRRRAVSGLPGGAALMPLPSLVEARQRVLDWEVSLRERGAPASVVLQQQGTFAPAASLLFQRLEAVRQGLDAERQGGRLAVTQQFEQLRRLALGVAVLSVLSLLSVYRLLRRGWSRLLRAETEQRMAALQLRGSLDSLSQGVAVFSSGGLLLNWNIRLRQILDLPTALLHHGLGYEVLEQHLAARGAPFLDPLPTLHAEPAGAAEQRPVVYERPLARRPRRVTTRGRGVEAGQDLQIEVRRTLMPHGGFVLTLTDVTERAQAERMLREAQKMQALGQLTGGIAHDFNNMLSVILGSLEAGTAAPGASDRERLQRLDGRVQNALQAARTGSALIRQLLAFARRQPLEPAPLDLAAAMPAIVPLLHHSLGEGIELSLAIEPDLWPALADEAQLESAILNLALNARDAMPSGGRLEIRLDNLQAAAEPEPGVQAGPADMQAVPGLPAGSYVRIAVSDTGQGMSQAVIDRAFEPFFTTKAEGHGTGLGLAMVFGFVRQLGGLATIRSEPGQGTTVVLHLPRADGLPVATATAPAAPVPQEPPAKPVRLDIVPNVVPGQQSPVRVLVVEDDAVLREIAAEILREQGCRVQEAADGEQALLMLRDAPAPDLLLTDISLPGGLDGHALAAQARRVAPALRVLFMSGHLGAEPEAGHVLQPGDLRRMLPGAVDETLLRDPAIRWLGKPFRRAQLVRAVGALTRPQSTDRAA